nr:hypothetical protein [Tanacetum cinerariifolium]
DDDIDIEGDEEEDEYLAPADSTNVTLPAVDHAPSAKETEPFKTDESAATPPAHPAYRVTARILGELVRDSLYRFVDTVERGEGSTPAAMEVGYGIINTWDDLTSMIYAMIEEKQVDQALQRARVNRLFRDRRYHARTASLIEGEAKASRTTWAQSMDASDADRFEVIALRTQQEEIRELRAIDRKLQAQFIQALTTLKSCQTQHTIALGCILILEAASIPAQPEKMAPKRTTRANPATTITLTTTSVTDAQLEALIEQGVAKALAARDTNKNMNMETVFRISNCSVENQIKFSTCTLLGSALMWWNSHVITVGPDVAYAMTWVDLKKKMTDKYCPRGEMKKLESELWNLRVKSNDVETRKGPASESSTKKKGRTVAITTKDMLKRRNDVKARITLLLALPDEHQLRFSKYETAKQLREAILKTFGGNEATKKTKKNQLKLQYGNFKAEGSETLEQTFNKLQAIVSHLKFIDVEIEQDDLNQKFLTSLAPKWLIGKGEVHTASFPTASTQVSTASIDVTSASLSHDTICAYIATQSNGSQIKYKDITQIDKDDIEEMDIKWNMALFSMRADRFWKKTGKKITIQGSDVAGFDKSKLECFDCHKMSHFARECRTPRSQDKGKRESYKQGPKEEEPAPKALMAIDGIGWYWSYMANEDENHALVADDEVPTEFALMAKSSSSLDNENKEGLGYSAVPPPPAQIYSPLKKDLSWTGLPEFVDDIVTDYRRPTPSIDTSKYNKSELQSSNFFVFEHGESTGSIMSKPMIKFVKEADCPRVIKINNTENARKSTVKYAEMYRNISKGPKGNLHDNINDKGYWDSGCSRHMTGNISYLSEYEPYDGGYMLFGHEGEKITGKGIIKTGKIEFENVYFVKELKYNLFNVPQIYDNKNSVLFTDSECLVLGKYFKLNDDTNVLLRTPRQHNMYSIDLNNIVPHKNLTCLVVKALVDESLPSKCFGNDHTCVACLKEKQHKASCKTKLVNSVSKPLHTLHMDLFGPTYVSSLNHKWYCLVVTDDFIMFTWTFFLRTKDETSSILRNCITEIENLHVDFLENKLIEKGAGAGPNWLFDIDTLTNLMNYVPVVVAGTSSTNISAHMETSNDTIRNSDTQDDSQKEQDCNADVPDRMKSKILTVSSPVPTVCLDISPESSSGPRLISKGVFSQKEAPYLGNALTLSNRFEDTVGDTTNAVTLNEVEADLSNMETSIPEEPKKIFDALKDPSWVESMQEEILQLIQNAKIDADYELAQRLQADKQEELTDAEKAKLFMQFLEKQRKLIVVKRAEEKRNRPPTRAQQRSIMCTYFKNIEGWKPKSLKNKSFDNIQELFDKAMNRVNTFVDYITKLVWESSKKAKAEVTKGSLKRAKEELKQENAKKQKIHDDKETYELKYHMLKDFDREDVKTLWKLVKAKHGSTRPDEVYERVLWGVLKVMFDPHVEDEVWKMQQRYSVVRWTLFNSYELSMKKLKILKKNFIVGIKSLHKVTDVKESSSSPFPTPTQEQVEPVDNFYLDLVKYCDQIPPIPEGASEDFKQTKGMFKCFGHFLFNLGKKKN